MDHSEHQTKALTRAGLNLIAQALSIYDSDLRLAVSNRPFRDMFDLPEHLVTPGARFEDTIRHLAATGEYGPIPDIEAFVAVRVTQARAFEPHYMERSRSNGRTISVEGSPLPQGGWVAVYTDITQAKQSEALLRARSEELSDQLLEHAEELSATNRKLAASIIALEETKRQLTEMESRTRLTTEMMPAHIAHVNAAAQVTFSNRRLDTVLPGRSADIVGRTLAQAFGPVAFRRIETHLKAAYDGAEPVFEFTDPDSSRRVRMALTPDRAGGVYLLSMDVTEETQARVALQQTRRREMAAQLTSGLAHDFSNLLTIILGMQSKLASMSLGDEAGALIDATKAAANRGGRLLNRIADMTSHRTLRPRPTDLQALLRDLRLVASPSLPDAVALRIEDDTPAGHVMLDSGMLQDALVNLILNARDACGPRGQITVRARNVQDLWIEIVVADSGPGFTETALSKALNPFFTTKGGDGSGLGLPMVYDMVKLAGGNLQLTNGGAGAVVTVRLPYRPALATSGGLALLVEDQEDLRSSIRDMLMHEGYSVIEAATVDEAAALVQDLPDISLVLSDIMLAGEGTGLDLLDRLQGQARPVILMTSLALSHPLHEQARAKVPVLQKPFAPNDLTTVLRAEAAA